jgi:transcriptional regulator with XRE-family HTH domain
MNINNLTAIKIKELRLAQNKSAESIAKALDVSKAAYSQLENGHTELTLTRIEALNKIFEVPLNKLLPNIGGVSQSDTVNNNNIVGGENNTVNNYYSTPEEKLQHIADNLNATIAEMKNSKL